MKYTLVFCLASFWMFELDAQTVYDFRLSEQNSTVYLNCIIHQGSSCQGISFERSTDSLNFEEIGKIFGVCGSTNFDQSYSLTDENPPKNQKVYYRLKLGERELSAIKSVLIVDAAKGMFIFPNPATENASVYFANDNFEEIQLLIADKNGRIVRQGETNQKQIQLPVTLLESGIYTVSLFQGTKLLQSGSLLVK